MKIGVFGLGYVGVVNVACFSKLGHTVYCTDVKQMKVHQVRSGQSPIVEPKIGDLLKSGVDSGHIIATENYIEVVQNCELLILCVGTPSKPDGEVNLSYIQNVISEIASVIKPEDRKFIAFRSTVPPGTTNNLSLQFLKIKCPSVVPVFFPEFLREGSAVDDFFEYGRCVIGKLEGHNIDELIDVLHICKTSPLIVTDLRTAEFSKYIDNSYHALKVTFANEIFSLGNDLQVNVQDAHKIFISDTKLNISTKYFRPGLPFGGSCLPKDVREVQHLMKQSDRELSVLKNIIQSNEEYIKLLYNKITKTGKKRISFIGLTFKNDSDDLRESPMLKILNELINEGNYEIKIWDEDLNMQNVRIDHPHIYGMITEFDEAMRVAEVVVVSKRYLQNVKAVKKPDQWVLNFSDEQYNRSNEIENLYN